jgi:hypothetical protein
VLIFKKGEERLSLQIFRNYKKAGLRVVTAKDWPYQDKSRIFKIHAGPWKNDGNRVSEPLLGGGLIYASIKVAAENLPRDVQLMKQSMDGESPQLAQSKEPIHVVSVIIDTVGTPKQN